MRVDSQSLLSILVLSFFLFSLAHHNSRQDLITASIHKKIDGLEHSTKSDHPLNVYCKPDVILEYRKSAYHQLWKDKQQVSAFIGTIANAGSEGLNPEDYHLKTINKLFRSDAPGDMACLDILLTDSFLLYVSHVSSGKVDRDQYTARWNVVTRKINPAVYLHKLDSVSVDDVMNEVTPDDIEYQRMKRVLSRYDSLLKTGGWHPVAKGNILKSGDRDHRVIEVRKRLLLSGDLHPVYSIDSPLYDDTLRQAVMRFQKRNGLKIDGVIGRNTLDVMNVPLQKRIQKIRVNMERCRWLPRNKGDFYVFVNSANFELKVVKDGKVISRNRVIVGKPYRRTPILSSKIEYLVFNPSWIIPNGILKNDVLPLIRKDPGYLKREHIHVIDSTGKMVAPSSIDWNDDAVAEKYILRQDPGKQNPLGHVKFVFPNGYSIYLHDTNARGLFDEQKRTLSSGCIRVEHALQLTHLLLNDEIYWSMDYIKLVVDAGTYQMAPLKVQPPIYVTYLTFWVDDDGTIQFRKDIYQRDANVLAALQSSRNTN